MCVILIGNKSKLSKYTKKAQGANPDGSGMMYSEDGVLKTFRTVKAGHFFKSFNAVKGDPYMVLHFRIATHGHIKEENAHPFLINQNLGMSHNGIFSITPINPLWSDTRMFAWVLSKYLHNSTNLKPVDQYIQKELSWSKLAFMDNKGAVTTYGPFIDLEDGVIASNNSFMYDLRDVGGKTVGKISNSKFPGYSVNYNYEDEFDWYNDKNTPSFDEDLSFSLSEYVRKMARKAPEKIRVILKKEFIIPDSEIDEYLKPENLETLIDILVTESEMIQDLWYENRTKGV